MAATRIIPIHYSNKKRISTIIEQSLGYSQNPDKTDGYGLITGHDCTYQTSMRIFDITIDEYYRQKGILPKSTDERSDILAYHFRQAFLPGEVTMEKAHEIGCETALAVTKGEHAFIVCTHIDKKHLHNHIIFCSVDMNSQKKWYNPFMSHKTLISPTSDYICKKHGLSIIEEKKQIGTGKYKPEMSGEKRQPSKRKTLKQFIDYIVENEKPKTFDDFLKLALEHGAEIKSGRTISQTYPEWQKAKKAKHVSLKIDGQTNFVKLDRLTPEYTIEGIKKRIKQINEVPNEQAPDPTSPSIAVTTIVQAGQNITGQELQLTEKPKPQGDTAHTEITKNQETQMHQIGETQNIQTPETNEASKLKTRPTSETEKPKPQEQQQQHPFMSKPIAEITTKRINLIIDIENSIKAQQSAGYERWAKIFNLKQMADALIILQQNNITSVDELSKTTQTAQDEYNKINERITTLNNRQKEINELQKTIGSYSKTKDIYTTYQKSGYSKQFLAENQKAIDTYKQARQAFSELTLDKIPSIRELQEEYRTLSAEKDNLYKARSEQKSHASEMHIVKTNIERWLEIRDIDEPAIDAKTKDAKKQQVQRPQMPKPSRARKSKTHDR